MFGSSCQRIERIELIIGTEGTIVSFDPIGGEGIIMSFFSDVFGAAGCNPDGSLGQNAFTQFVDTSLDGHSMIATGQLSEQQHQQLIQEAMTRQMAMQNAPEMMNSGG